MGQHRQPHASSRITEVQSGTSATGSASPQQLAAAQSLSTDSSPPQQVIGRLFDGLHAA